MRLGGDQQLFNFRQFSLVHGVEAVAQRLGRAADGGELIVLHRGLAGERALGEREELLPAGGVLGRHLGVDDEARGAPVLRHGVSDAVDGARPEEARVLGGRVVAGEQLEVEGLDQVEVLVGGNRVVGRHQHVPAGGACLQLGQHFLVRTEDVDVDVDARLLGEVVVVLLREVVGPGGDVQRAREAGIGLAGTQARHGGAEHGGGKAEARDTEEVTAGDAALLEAAEFVEEFAGRDVVRMLGHGVFSLCVLLCRHVFGRIRSASARHPAAIMSPMS